MQLQEVDRKYLIQQILEVIVLNEEIICLFADHIESLRGEISLTSKFINFLPNYILLPSQFVLHVFLGGRKVHSFEYQSFLLTEH